MKKAFPQAQLAGADVPVDLADHGGMELRDYFAAQVISQCHITVTREEPEPDAEMIRIFAERYARTAYVIADAMLRARA